MTLQHCTAAALALKRLSLCQGGGAEAVVNWRTSSTGCERSERRWPRRQGPVVHGRSAGGGAPPPCSAWKNGEKQAARNCDSWQSKEEEMLSRIVLLAFLIVAQPFFLRFEPFAGL